MTEPTIVPGKTRIGWIGTGVMGSSMAGHLLNKGYAATVFNRTRDKAKPLLERGAQWGDSPKAVAQKSDIIFSIVGFPHDVREVILGSDGALNGASAGSVLVDMTTSDPSLASMPPYPVGMSAPGRRGSISWSAATKKSWNGYARSSR